MPLPRGATAPKIPDLPLEDGPRALFFYKVTCPVCQMAAPKVQTIEQAYPGAIVGVGQDPADRLDAFATEHGVTFPSASEDPPYETSRAYGIEIVPTTFLVDGDGTILRTVQAWDRDGLNDLSQHLAELLDRPYVPVSTPGDGLPPLRPG